MRLQRVFLIAVVLLTILLPACSKSEPTPTTAPIAIPDLQKPASGDTPSPGGQADTPVPPKSETAYPAPGEVPSGDPYPVPLDGNALLERTCAVHHTLDRVKGAKKDAAGWKTTVDRMIGKGAQITPEEAAVLVTYLAETYK